MKILYISEIYPDVKRGLGVWGGGEKRVYEVSKRIADLGYDVTILTCRFPFQPSEEIVDGIKVYRIGLSRNPEKGGALKSFGSVLNYIAKTVIMAIRLNPDIIHCNTYFPVYSGVMASGIKKIPLVSTFHDIYGLKGWIDSQESILWGLLGHIVTIISLYLPQKRMISVSPQCKEKILSLGIPSKKIKVIPNGVDLKLFDSISIEKINNQVLYVGRLVNFKHVDWLIYAFDKILKKIPNAKLKIVGDGPERPNLEKIVMKLKLQKHITFTGTTPTYDSVVKYFKESSVFVLPSIVEGEAIVLKEAMTAYLPIIVMNIKGSGVLSLIRDKENGFLLEPGKPNLIAEKIILLLKNENMRKDMGINGRKFMEKYDWNYISEEVLQVYKELI